MPKESELDALEPGKYYSIRLSDCCIKGTIYAGRFIAKTMDDGEPWEYVFENCVIGPYWGGWHPEPFDVEERNRRIKELIAQIGEKKDERD